MARGAEIDAFVSRYSDEIAAQLRRARAELRRLTTLPDTPRDEMVHCIWFLVRTARDVWHVSNPLKE
jgi:hypothetical protein